MMIKLVIVLVFPLGNSLFVELAMRSAGHKDGFASYFFVVCAPIAAKSD